MTLIGLNGGITRSVTACDICHISGVSATIIAGRLISRPPAPQKTEKTPARITPVAITWRSGGTSPTTTVAITSE